MIERKTKGWKIECLQIRNIKGELPISQIDDVSYLIKSLKSSLSLSTKGLLEMCNILRTARELTEYVKDLEAPLPTLQDYFSMLYSNKDIENKISSCIISEDTIADNASPKLYSIRNSKKVHPLHKDIKINGKLSDIEGFIKENNVDELYCALPSEEDNVGNLAKIADNYDVAFYYVPMISGFMTTTFDLTSFGNIPVLVYRPNPLRHLHNRLLKRFFDIVVSLVAIGVAACTILIPVVIAIKVSSKGPVLFKQKRTGYKGREFTCLKFRTMKVNQEADTMQATKDDPRKTRVGDFLRRTSIDEIPQFLNVLAGSMSVVGPRPHMVKQTDEYKKLIDRYMVRHMIKPGITGLAQVHGYRGQTKELWQMEKRVEYDVMYIETWSLWLDIKIIIRTIINAVKGEKNAF